MTRHDDTEADAARFRLERLKTRGLDKWRAIQRLAGSTVLGVVAAWKLLAYEPAGEGSGIPWRLFVWFGLALLAFGLASWDQLTKAARR